MALSSMTGFARSHDACGAYAFEWELRSVNAKGFDLRMRLPPGWDAVEPLVRKRATELLARGTVYANLTVKRADAGPVIRVNDEVLASVMKVAADLSAKLAAAPPTVDGILAIKGVLEVSEPDDTEAGAAGRGGRHPQGFRSGAQRTGRDAPSRGSFAAADPGLPAGRDRGARQTRGCGAWPAGRGGQGEARRAGRDAARTPRNASMPTGCTRRRS